MAFCPKCGKKGIKGRFCTVCTAKELDLGFKDISIKKCIECPKLKIKNKWQAFDDADEGLVQAAIGKITNPGRIALEVVTKHDEFKNKPGAAQDIEFEVTAEGQTFIIPAIIDFTYCDRCCKSGTEYFEGTLQLRETTPEVVDFVVADVAAQDGVFIAKQTGSRGSIDMKISSARYLRRLGKKLDQRFRGELTITSKLFTRNKQTSKEVHRVTVLFKLRNYNVGDIIEELNEQLAA